MGSLKGKKLLILAGADVHVKVVQAAKELGVYTIVTDYLSREDSPAKQIAEEYWDLSITDVDEIADKAQTCPRTVYRYLQAFKDGVIPPDETEHFVHPDKNLCPFRT